MRYTHRLRALAAVCVLLVGGLLATLAIMRLRNPHLLLYVTATPDFGLSIAMLDSEVSTCSSPRFIDGGLTDVLSAQWSPDRVQIVYVLWSAESERASLWAMNPNGSGRKQQTPPLPAEFDTAFMRLSPDQRYVALLLKHNQKDPYQWETDIMDTQMATSHQVMTATSFFEWSPVKNQLAVSRWNVNDSALYLVQPNGTILGKYEDAIPSSRALVWSPDGQRVAFASSYVLTKQRSSRVSEIYSLDIQTGQIKQLSNNGSVYEDRSIFSLSGSPDGKQLSFVSNFTNSDGTGENYVLFILDVGSGRETRLADHVEWSAPVWSPDSKRIAFVSTKDGSNYGQIYLVEVASGKITQLTCTDEIKQSLSW